jgi:hypothetical protein
MPLLAPLIGIFVVVAIRYVLFAHGTLYTAQDAQWSNWIVAALAALIAVRAVRAQTGATTADRVATLSGLAAIAAGVIGVGSLLAPVTPRDATAPACVGAAVSGGKYLATTVRNGANARGGPDESYAQVRRFASGCTLSFDGYCIGQPEKDIIFGTSDNGELEDQRWLILHRSTLGTLLLGKDDDHPMFVASGVIQSQSADSELGDAPAKQCDEQGGWAPPERISFVARKSRNGDIHLKARAAKAILIGFSVVNVGRSGGNDIHRLSSQVHPQRVTDGDAAAATIKAASAVGPWGPTLVVASACLAPNVIVTDNYAVWKITAAASGELKISDEGQRLDSVDRTRAVTAACSTG